MCLILFAYQQHPDYPLIVAANRDEQYARAATRMHRWQDHPQVVAGRDQVAGGTWLGMTDEGRFAAVTNFANQHQSLSDPNSRGDLIRKFLSTETSPDTYAKTINGQDYQGFNLLLYDGQKLVITSNRGDCVETLKPGIYGLSNAEFGCSWPKVVDGVECLDTLLKEEVHIDRLLQLLTDQLVASDERLPERGNSIELERSLGSRFIIGDTYGTRASTAVLISQSGWQMSEQSYGPGGEATFRVDFTT